MSLLLQVGNSPRLGDILDLVAIGILLIAGYHYARVQIADTADEEEEARRNLTAVVLVFVFYAAVTNVYWGHTDASVTLIGQSVELYFDNVAASVDGIGPTAPGEQTPLNRIVDAIRTLGLVAYVLFAGATAIVGSAPKKLLDALSG